MKFEDNSSYYLKDMIKNSLIHYFTQGPISNLFPIMWKAVKESDLAILNNLRRIVLEIL